MTATDTFKITKLSYDEMTDELTARAFQHASHTLNAPVEEHDAVVKFEMMISSEGALIRSLSPDYLTCDFAYCAAVLSAFAKAFQQRHDEDNPGDSPAFTYLDTFEVVFEEAA